MPKTQLLKDTEIEAASAFVDGIISKADRYIGNAPMWFGWALRDAFLKGIEFEKKVKTK